MALIKDINGQATGVAAQAYLRLIPNGFADANGARRTLRATLMLTPLCRDDAPDGVLDLDLARWPIEVAKLLTYANGKPSTEAFNVMVAPAGDMVSDTFAGDLQDARPVTAVRFAKPKFIEDFAERKLDIYGCWRDSLLADVSGDKPLQNADKPLVWKSLADSIAAILRGSRAAPGEIGSEDNSATKAKEMPKDKFGDAGQVTQRAATGERLIDAILSMPHADAALALETQRAHELAQSIADNGVETARELPDTTAPTTFDPSKITVDTDGLAALAEAYKNGTLTDDNGAPLGEPGFILRAAEFIPFTLVPVVEPAEGEETPKNTFDLQVTNWERSFYSLLTDEGIEIESDVTQWRTDHEATLEEARAVSTNTTVRLIKIAEFNALNMHPDLDRQRADASAAYRKALEKFAKQEPLDTCTYTAVTPAEAAAQRAKGLAAARRTSDIGLWPNHPNARDPLGVGAVKPAPAFRLGDFNRDDLKEAFDIAGQAYFSIEASPSQSRIFGLAVDIEITLPEGLADEPFLLMSATVEQKTYGPRIPVPWTLTKLRTHPPVVKAFGWPVSLGEYLIWRKDSAKTLPILPSHCIPQYDGVIVMGALPSGDGAKVPRYDITSLDVETALEAEKVWLSSVEDKREELDAIGEVSADGQDASRAEVARQLRTLLSVGPDYQSNGLTLLCRSAAQDAVRKLATAAQKCSIDGACVGRADVGVANAESIAAGRSQLGQTFAVHDAEDLTNGFRVAVGTPDGGPSNTRWRSLMGRYFRYDRTGKGGRMVEELLREAIGSPGSQDRIEIESASTAVPSRDKVSSVSPSNGQAVESFIEEAVTNWDGTPGGVACAGIGEATNEDEKINDIMCYGRRSYIPDSSGDDRPPPLRYGRPYRFALQVVFSGGRSVPTDAFPEEITEIAELSKDGRSGAAVNLEGQGDVRARLYYPSAGLASQGKDSNGRNRAVPFTRALRHARIGAPTLLIPKGHAMRRNGPMGLESAGKMIVRTMRTGEDGEDLGSRDRSRGQPALSQRIILVPHLPLSIAARHTVREGSSKSDRQGVLDRFSNPSAPPGALSSVRYAQGRQGFPTVRTRFKSGINGEAYIDDRLIDTAADADTTPDGEESAASVFWHREQGQRRKTDYFPDPAPDTLVIRARRVAGPDGQREVLDGAPVAIDLAREGASYRYPYTLPVLLSLRKSRQRDESKPLKQGAVIDSRGIVTFDANRSGDVIGGNRLSAAAIDLRLAPGDQFDIEMWLVPSAWRLAHDFATVQGLIQYFCNLGGTTPGNCTYDALAAGIRKSKVLPLEKRCSLLQALAGSAGGLSYIGPGGDILPGSDVLRAMGKALREMMLTHPLPEIAATRTIAAIHAVNVPKNRKPRILALPPSRDPFPAASRPESACPIAETDPLSIRALRPSELGQPVEGFSTPDAIAPGAKTAALVGEVALDLARIDTIELVAKTVSPESAVFDDPKRGRSLAHRLAGTWPGAVADPDNPRRAVDVFGFRVARDGRVDLRQSDVTLLRIEGLPFPEAADRPGRIELAPYFLETDPVKQTLVSRRHLFPDGKARRLRLRVNGLARTAEHMTTVSRVARLGDPWLSGSGLVYIRGELVPSERLDKALQRNFSAETEVILPATVRPASVEANAPIPTFEHERSGVEREGTALVFRYTRRACVRLRLRRGWFSSGVDEKLGIILWPPEQTLADNANLAVNRIPLRRSKRWDHNACDESARPLAEIDRLVVLTDFSDEDLGPGGAFVTRRATDPVRMNEHPSELRETQMFLSRSAFPDLLRHPDDAAQAEFVPHTLMPLSDTDVPHSKGGEANANGTVDIVPPMAVSLVTYQPRFDITEEEWFVNVLLEPGRSADSFVRFGLVRYQPHTRPELRCSRPVVQWAQPLPERRVTVTSRADDDHVEIRVEGPVSEGRAIEMVADAPSDDPFVLQQHERAAPRIRFTASRRTTAPSGADARDAVWIGAADLSSPHSKVYAVAADRIGVDGSVEIAATIEDAQGVWTARIQRSFFEENGWDIDLTLEEIEYFLPADFGDAEPMDPKDVSSFREEQWREGGARFSTVIDLSEFNPKPVGTK